jgi:hypothetical protein
MPKTPHGDALPCKLLYGASNLVGLRRAKEMAIIADLTHGLEPARLVQRVEEACA